MAGSKIINELPMIIVNLKISKWRFYSDYIGTQKKKNNNYAKHYIHCSMISSTVARTCM